MKYGFHHFPRDYPWSIEGWWDHAVLDPRPAGVILFLEIPSEQSGSLKFLSEPSELSIRMGAIDPEFSQCLEFITDDGLFGLDRETSLTPTGLRFGPCHIGR